MSRKPEEVPLSEAERTAYWSALILLEAATVSRIEALTGQATKALARLETGSTMAQATS